MVFPSFQLGLTRHTADRVLFLIPVLLATFAFRRKGALITLFAALAAMLPRAILISPVPSDAILESIGVIGVSVLASWGIWTRAEERDKTKAAMAELHSAHEVLQEHVQSLRKSEKRQNILNTISNLLGESLELDKVLKKAIHMVSELMEVDIALIFSLNEAVQELRLAACEGVSDQFMEAVGTLKVGEGFYGEVAKTRQPMVVEDTSHDTSLEIPAINHMRIQTQLIVPMIITGKTRGVLCIAMRRPRQFSVEDMELLTSVGTQIATAMENARLYDKERETAQRLSISERNYRRLFENANDAIWVHDLQGNVTAANNAAGRLFGYKTEELKNINVRKLLSEESLNRASEVRRKLLKEELVEQPYEQRFLRNDGTEAILKVSTSVVTENKKPIGFQHIARDVTEERKAEEMLTKTIDGSPLPTFAINKQHEITHWNAAMEALSGLRKDEALGTDKQWMMFYSDKRPAMADLMVDEASEEQIETYYGDTCKKSVLIKGAYEAEDFFPAIGERGKWLHFMASPIKDNSGNIVGAIETLRDVTEQRKMQDSLRYYLGEITKAQEEERKRIARELHDDTSQALYALVRQVDNFTRTSHDASDTATFLRELHEQLNNLLEGIRRFAQELRPPMLDDLGLLAALRWQVSDLKNRTGIDAQLIVSGTERRFPAETELTIFRVVQEALRNTEKHSGASKVKVAIRFAEGKTTVTISDNGRGFDSGQRLADLPRAGKLGLAGMEERVRLLNGSLNIESKAKTGTKLKVEFPI